jgi:chemotaxis protein histidine kinase CheA
LIFLWGGIVELDRAEYLGVFLEEAKAAADAVDRSLERLRTGFDRRAVNAALIPLERLNGAAGVLDMSPVADLTRVMSQAFSLVRRRQSVPDQVMFELLAVGSGRLRSIVEDLERTGTTEQSVAELCASMARAGGEAKEDGTVTVDAIKQECLEQVQRSAAPNRLGAGPSVITMQEEVTSGRTGGGAWGKMRVAELRVRFSATLAFKETRAYQLLRNLAAIGTVLASVPEWNEMNEASDEMRVLLVTDEPDSTVMASAHSISGIEDAEILAVSQEEGDSLEPDAEIGRAHV